MTQLELAYHRASRPEVKRAIMLRIHDRAREDYKQSDPLLDWRINYAIIDALGKLTRRQRFQMWLYRLLPAVHLPQRTRREKFTAWWVRLIWKAGKSI